MTSQYLKGHGTRETPQSERMREDQVENTAGGFAWEVGPFERLRRFLILGSEGGSYYAGQRELTKQNVDALRECMLKDGPRTVTEIVSISTDGRAPKNELAIFALAYVAGNGDQYTRSLALEALPEVCRTGTHLFQFVEYVQEHRGWGPALKKAVARWYLEKDPERLAYQLVKYRQRGGWTHADVLRLAKPTPQRGSVSDRLFAWTVGKPWDGDKINEQMPAILRGYEETIAEAHSPESIAKVIREYKLPREAVPSDLLTSPEVWEALLDVDMPMTALIRNLANMTRIGLLTPSSSATAKVLVQLADGERLHKARVHPISVLMALLTYASGQSVRGSNTWNPIPAIVDALDVAFYKAFDNVEPTGKRYLLALDVSGSMNMGEVAGVPGLTPRMASSAMAMVTAQTEALYECVGFYAAGPHGWNSPQRGPHTGYSNGLTPIPLSKRQRLDDIVRFTHGLPFGGTDCALPMLYALDNDREVDVFVVFTDSETWAGGIHPMQALQQYRERSGIPAKLITVGMVSNGFSIGDPNDPGALDVVGFDAAAPAIMADFAMGKV